MNRVEEHVCEQIERRSEELSNLAVELGEVYGPTGYEGEIAQRVAEWLDTQNMPHSMHTVVEDRSNVVSRLKGEKDQRSILFNAHLDTAEGLPDDTSGRSFKKPFVEGDRIYGKSVVNDRGPMAATMMAGKVLHQMDLELHGDVILSMVVGEIGSTPVDEFQGGRYLGKGLGSRQLVERGVWADFALVAETSRFGIIDGEAGMAYLKISVPGEPIYHARAESPDELSEHPSAIVQSSRVIQALEEWAREYEQERTYALRKTRGVPRLNVGAIRAGLPFKPAVVPGQCDLYVHVFIPPGMRPLDIRREVERRVHSVNEAVEVELYASARGYEVKEGEELIQAVEQAHQNVCGSETPPPPVPEVSMWRDTNVFNEVGIPSICFGPPRYREGNEPEFLLRDELVEASKIYALTALSICGYEDRPLG